MKGFSTQLFSKNEHGYLGACTNALNIVTAAMLGFDRDAAFVWPLQPGEQAADFLPANSRPQV